MRGNHLLRAALAAALVLGSGVPAGAGGFFFKDGDTVVVMGDSITEQHLYSNYLEAWTLLRWPAWKITFHNVGIGGDTSGGGNGRFARDVLEYKPTALTVDFGMNDGGYGGFDKGRFDAYMNGLVGIWMRLEFDDNFIGHLEPFVLTKVLNSVDDLPGQALLQKFRSERDVERNC